LSARSESSLLRADITVIALAVIVGVGFSQFLTSAQSPFTEAVFISPSVSRLPEYALLSLTRSIIALCLSMVFAILYGTLAANNKILEKTLMPLADVLQSLPVIAFLPGFVLALISLFHGNRLGLEISCILTIFTGQVWNLIFAYYESQKSIPPEFREVAQVYRLSHTHRFFFVELPNGMRPLIYNGMMSMAGGWFFLTTCEAFTLGNKDFRLPGLGSYLAQTFTDGYYFNFLCGIAVLIIIIIGTDFFIWKPLVAWVSRFQESEDGQGREGSLFFETIKNTQLLHLFVVCTKRVLMFLFPRTDLTEEGSTRRHLIGIIDKIIQFFARFRGGQTPRKDRIKRFSFVPLVVTFSIGGLVFSLLPRLPEVGQSMSTLTHDDWFDLIHGVFFTGLKVFLVVIFSSLWTVPIGLYLGLNPRLERIFQPLIQNLAAFPAPVLFPFIALILISIKLPPFFISTILMCLGCQWYILFNVMGGASRIPADLKLVSKVYQFSVFKRFHTLYLPAILPSFITGLMTAAGAAWNASMVAEIVYHPAGVLRSAGIGAELVEASAHGNYPKLIAGIICIVIVLVIINRTVWRTLNLSTERYE